MRARSTSTGATPPSISAVDNDPTGLLRGAVAGLLATVPMTAAMLVFGALPQRRKREPFPPHQVTAGMTGSLGIWQHADDAQRYALTLISHFGYGALAGAIYGAVVPSQSRRGTGRGVAYALLVWSSAYAGWLPALDIVPPPWREHPSRTLQLVAAHVVWGAVLGLLVE